MDPQLRAKYVGSADCVATILLARRFCEPRRALQPPRRETGYTMLPRKIARRALRRPRAPTNPHGLHEGLRESQAPARTHANSKLLATQSGDPFCFALTTSRALMMKTPTKRTKNSFGNFQVDASFKLGQFWARGSVRQSNSSGRSLGSCLGGGPWEDPKKVDPPFLDSNTPMV